MIRQPALRALPLAALLAWAPLPFGSATPRAAMVLRVTAFALAALALWIPVEGRARRAAVAPILALGAIAGLGFAQSCSLPIGLTRALSPRAAALAGENAALLGEAQPRAVPPSLAPLASRDASLDWLVPCAALAAGLHFGSSRRARRALASAVVGGGLFQVLYGAQQWFARATTIWRVPVPADQGARLRGSFVNPNHLATYLAIALAITFAWLWWSVRQALRERGAEGLLRRLGPAAVVWLGLFVGLAFTASRAGLAAVCVATLAQAALVATREERRRVALGAVAILALGLLAIAAVGFREGLGRILGSTLAGAAGDARALAWSGTLQLWSAGPWFGSGLGSFRAAFPLVQPVGLGESVWWHAHNDWLELLATAGIAGAILALAGTVLLARELWSAFRDGERSEDAAAPLAALGALLAVALQELVDFGLTMPGNAFTLAALCGAALAIRRRAAAPAPGAQPAPAVAVAGGAPPAPSGSG